MSPVGVGDQRGVTAALPAASREVGVLRGPGVLAQMQHLGDRAILLSRWCGRPEIDESGHTLNHLAQHIRTTATSVALARRRNCDTYARLAAGSGTSTAWRYVREAVALLGATVDGLATAMDGIRRAGVPDPRRHADLDPVLIAVHVPAAVPRPPSGRRHWTSRRPGA